MECEISILIGFSVSLPNLVVLLKGHDSLFLDSLLIDVTKLQSVGFKIFGPWKSLIIIIIISSHIRQNWCLFIA